MPKPDRIALATIRHYDVVYAGNATGKGCEYVKFHAPKRVEWFEYRGTELVPGSA